MLISAIAAIAFAAPVADLTCPIMGNKVNVEKAAYSDYNGVRVYYCCPGCKTTFEKYPAKAMEAAAKKEAVVGVFLFDPVSGNKVAFDGAPKSSSDYNGVRFYFQNKGNKAKFDADPKKFGALPAKESLYCPVGKEAVASYVKASGYVDHEGVRYYLCCAGCDSSLRKEPAKHVGNAKDHVKAPGVATDKRGG